MSTEIDGVNGIIKNTTSDGDITIKGNDGGSEISALTLDMSDAGTATFNHDIKLGTDQIAKFGDAANLQIYANNINSFITESGGSGNLKIQGQTIRLEKTTEEIMLRAVNDAQVELYYDNVIKVLTASTGINLPVDGDSIKFGANSEVLLTHVHNTGLEISATSASDLLTLKSTDAGAEAGPNLVLFRDSASPANDDVIGRMRFEGEDNEGNKTVYAQLTSQIIDKGSSGGEDSTFQMEVFNNGALRDILKVKGATNGLPEVVFNDASQDVNFRIESNGNEYMLFVDGNSDCVNIGGTTVAGGKLNVQTSDDSDSIVMVCTSTNASEGPVLKFKRDNNSSADGDLTGAIKFQAESDANSQTVYTEIQASIEDDAHGSEKGRITLYNRMSGTDRNVLDITAANIVFNQDSQDLDFRVESNNNTNMLSVDAGDDRTHFGGTSHNGHGLGVHNFYGNTTTDQPNLIISSNADAYTDDQIHTGCMRTGTSAWFIARHRSGNASNDAFNDTEFSIRGDGNAFCDGSFSGGGADYAEYFEWKDGNSSDEDRVGYSVVFDGNKIVKATDSDDTSKIIGVISGNPAVVGDNDIDRWKQKYLKDDFGRYIFEDYTITRWTEIVEGGHNIEHSYATDRIPEGITAPSDATVISTEKNKYGETVNFFRKKTNPDWDKDTAYISREDRKEWDTVGLMGKLRLRKGQPTGTNWIKMRDISDTVEEWLVR